MNEQQKWPEPVYLTKDHAINMTLRDYIAIKAMEGLLSGATAAGYVAWEEVATGAYKQADAMMKAREQ